MSSTDRRFTCVVGAAVALACALSAAPAIAQPAPPKAAASATLVAAPRMAGPWTVTGWSHRHGPYCTAERGLPGAAGAGASLQFILVRGGPGYRLGLASDVWELEPRTTFPVELIAAPAFRSDATAVVVSTKVAVIELGADRGLMQKLAAAGGIEVRTAQTTLELPVDAFGVAVAEIDACFAALSRPAVNPFAPSGPLAKPPAPTPDGDHHAPSATPAEVRIEIVPPVRTIPVRPVAARGDELIEERTFLAVHGDKGPYRLEALVVRPANAERPLPVALITHGKNARAVENQQLRADMMLPQARDLAARGWLAVAVIRRGYGQSDGIPGVSRGAAYMGCENGDLVRGFDLEAEDLDAALKAVARRPDADGSRAIAVGQSLGGGAVLALAARRPAGLLAVISVSGGVWRTGADGGVCASDPLVTAMAAFGARSSIPALWLYAENDSLFPPELVTRMHGAYVQAGGRADLRMVPPIVIDGHNLFADFGGRVRWLRALDQFLRGQQLPNTNIARTEEVLGRLKLPVTARPLIEEYLSAPAPKVLVVAVGGKGAHWVANPGDLDGARQRVMTRCREATGAECAVAMQDNVVVERIATRATSTRSVAR
jgi:dienelactone hydrolase